MFKRNDLHLNKIPLFCLSKALRALALLLLSAFILYQPTSASADTMCYVDENNVCHAATPSGDTSCCSTVSLCSTESNTSVVRAAIDDCVGPGGDASRMKAASPFIIDKGTGPNICHNDNDLQAVSCMSGGGAYPAPSHQEECSCGGGPQCGSALGVGRSSAPTSGLCASGTASAVSGSGPWTWTCSEKFSGTEACSAPVTCPAGQTWNGSSCVGAAVNGSCGAANGVSRSSAPSSGLCNSGTATGVSGSGPWSWNCTGSNGGSTASCNAPKTSTGCHWVKTGGQTCGYQVFAKEVPTHCSSRPGWFSGTCGVQDQSDGPCLDGEFQGDGAPYGSCGDSRVYQQYWTCSGTCPSEPSCTQTATTETQACTGGRSGNMTRTKTTYPNNSCSAAATYSDWNESSCSCPAGQTWNGTACLSTGNYVSLGCNAGTQHYNQTCNKFAELTDITCGPGERTERNDEFAVCPTATNNNAFSQRVRCVADASCNAGPSLCRTGRTENPQECNGFPHTQNGNTLVMVSADGGATEAGYLRTSLPGSPSGTCDGYTVTYDAAAASYPICGACPSGQTWNGSVCVFPEPVCAAGWGEAYISYDGWANSANNWCSNTGYGQCQGGTGSTKASSTGNINVCCYGEGHIGWLRQCGASGCSQGTESESQACTGDRYGNMTRTRIANVNGACGVHGDWQAWDESACQAIAHCGSASGQKFYADSPPGGGALCTEGTASSVSGNFSWTCQNGTQDPISCSASEKCRITSETQTKSCATAGYKASPGIISRTRTVNVGEVCGSRGPWSTWDESSCRFPSTAQSAPDAECPIQPYSRPDLMTAFGPRHLQNVLETGNVECVKNVVTTPACNAIERRIIKPNPIADDAQRQIESCVKDTSCMPRIDAKCGSASGTVVTSAPSSGLCEKGDPTQVTGTGPWKWSCSVKNTADTVAGKAAACEAQVAPPSVVKKGGICEAP